MIFGDVTLDHRKMRDLEVPIEEMHIYLRCRTRERPHSTLPMVKGEFIMLQTEFTMS